MRVVEDTGFAYWCIAVAAQQREGAGRKGSASILSPPPAEMIFFTEVEIHLCETRFVESRGADVGDEIVCPGSRSEVGSGPELQQRQRDRIGNCRAFCSRRHASRADRWSYLPEAFIGCKEEHSVLEDWPAQSSAVLIAVQRILRAVILVREKVRGVEHGIAQILKRRSMKRVGAAFGNDAHLSAGAAAELRRGYARLHRKFLHRIGDAEIPERRIDLRVDVAHAIEQKYVGLGTGAGHVESPALRAGRRRQHPRR